MVRVAGYGLRVLCSVLCAPRLREREKRRWGDLETGGIVPKSLRSSVSSLHFEETMALPSLNKLLAL